MFSKCANPEHTEFLRYPLSAKDSSHESGQGLAPLRLVPTTRKNKQFGR